MATRRSTTGIVGNGLRSIGAAAVLAFTAAACVTGGGGPSIPPVTTTTIPVGFPDTPVGDDAIRLNQLQLAGAHNSYHIALDPNFLSLVLQAAQSFPDLAGPLGDPAELDYTHASIPQQLARGLRTFEFDIYADPTGGRFSHPRIPTLLGVQDPLLPTGLEAPGFKVIHIADLDYRTQCATLDLCLSQIKAFSDANPGHLPIIINLELKESGIPASLGGATILPFDGPTLDAVDAALTAALGDRLITPDDVRGAAPDLNTAITTTGWPTVADSRGKVLFFMDNESLRDPYLAGHPSLQGRVMFTSSGEGQPDGAILKVNDPGDGTQIQALVQQGYIVRTRADQALVGDVVQRDIALASGAQIVHTDFPKGEPLGGSGYIVDLGLPVQGRCNPVTTTPATCDVPAIVEPD